MSRRAREICEEECGRKQLIQLHCFQGPASEVTRWLDAFPNTYFSVGGIVKTLTPEHLEGLRAIPTDRLLLETDSPYLPLDPTMWVNTPRYLGDIAVAVAQARGMDLGQVAAATLINSDNIFGLIH